MSQKIHAPNGSKNGPKSVFREGLIKFGNFHKPSLKPSVNKDPSFGVVKSLEGTVCMEKVVLGE